MDSCIRKWGLCCAIPRALRGVRKSGELGLQRHEISATRNEANFIRTILNRCRFTSDFLTLVCSWRIWKTRHKRYYSLLTCTLLTNSTLLALNGRHRNYERVLIWLYPHPGWSRLSHTSITRDSAHDKLSYTTAPYYIYILVGACNPCTLLQ